MDLNFKKAASAALSVAAACFAIISITSRIAQGQQQHLAAAPLTAEAQRQAEQFWSKWLTKCGDAYFDGAAPGGLREFREMRFGMHPEPLSSADQLNGIQWKGSAIYAARAWRVQEGGVWGPWQDGPSDGPTIKSAGERGFGAVYMEKKDGQWTFSKKLSDHTRPDSCASITGLK